MHHRKVSEEIPGITEKRYPGSSPYQIVYHEIVIMHLPHSSYKWGKSAHNGNKPLEENGFRFRMETAAYFEDGRIKNVYLEGEYGGFAIHIMQK